MHLSLTEDPRSFNMRNSTFQTPKRAVPDVKSIKQKPLYESPLTSEHLYFPKNPAYETPIGSPSREYLPEQH